MAQSASLPATGRSVECECAKFKASAPPEVNCRLLPADQHTREALRITSREGVVRFKAISRPEVSGVWSVRKKVRKNG